MRGVVRWFSPTRGYGFIRVDGADAGPGRDLFLHHSEIERRPGEVRVLLLEGEMLEFELAMDKRRRRCAVRVRRLPDQVGRAQGESDRVGAGEAPGGSRVR